MDPVLVYVEDPGAANYLLPLVDGLVRQQVPVELGAARAVLPYLEARGVHPQWSGAAPDRPMSLYVFGTSENLDTPAFDLLRRARAQGVTSVAGIDFPTNAHARFRGRTDDPLAHAPDWLMVADEATADCYATLGFRRDRITVVGHPHFDVVVETRARLEREGRSAVRARVFPDAPAAQPIVVFLAEISSGLEPDEVRRSADYTLLGRGGQEGRTEIVIEEFLDATGALDPRPWRILRLHPKNWREEFGTLADEFDAVSSGGAPLEFVFGADLVVGMSTMLLYEADLLGRPTLSILPRRAECAWLPSIEAGRTVAATTRNEIRGALPRLLSGAAVVPRRSVEPALSRALAFLAERLGEVTQGFSMPCER